MTGTLRQVFHDDAGTDLLLTYDDGSCLIELATPASSKPAMLIHNLLPPEDMR